MESTKQFRRRINILLSATALFFSFIIKAQVNLDINGKVGVGTATPAQKLDVVGSINASTSFMLGGVNAIFQAGNNIYGNFRVLQNNSTAYSDGMYINYGSPGTTGAHLRFFANGTTERMRIDALTGRVGIGITAPLQTLDVNGRMYLRNGVIQKGGTTGITGTSDLGLYSYDATFMRFVTNSQPIHFFIDGGTGGIGTTPIMTVAANGSVGVSNQYPSASYKLDVGGNFNVNGLAYCTNAAWSGSDQQFKTNIDSISNALSLINQLKPRSFYFDTTNVYGLNFSDLKQYGLIAQDVEPLLPELVTSSTKLADVDTLGNVIHPSVTYKSLNYNAFISIMLQGIKEQSSKIVNLETKNNTQDSIITSLQNQMNTLASMINSCCDDNHDNGNHNGHHKTDNNQTNVELNDAQSVILLQNIPNPFAEQTSINYSLPDNTVKAEMLFYNAQGKLIQSTELTQKGKGTLNVFASDLSSGIYTYTLVVDGKIVETKKMVKQ